MKKVQYATWEAPDGEGYWCLFDSFREAVASGPRDGIHVFRFSAVPLGKFKEVLEIVRVKKRKRKNK